MPNISRKEQYADKLVSMETLGTIIIVLLQENGIFVRAVMQLML